MRKNAPGWTILVRFLVSLVVFFPEGLQKLIFPDVLGAGRFARIGIPFPDLMGPFVGILETVCGALIIVGLFTRLAAVPLIIIMVVALVSTKLPIRLGHDVGIFHLSADIKRLGFWSMMHEAPADLTHAARNALSSDRGRGAGAWSLDAVLSRDGAASYLREDCEAVTLDRRSLLKCAGLVPILGAMPRLARAASDVATEKADYTLRIATGLVELAPDHIVSTTLYNGQFPGPLLRFTQGQKVVVDIYNDTDTPELVHWHGQMIPSNVDGSAEEGSPFVPAHGMRRIAFTPKPAGFRFYHTHVVAGGDLNRGTYTGQAGPVYIEPKNNPGAYDREVFLVMKEFEPSFSRGGDMAMDVLAGAPIKALQQMGKQPTRKRRRRLKASRWAMSSSVSMAACSVTVTPFA